MRCVVGRRRRPADVGPARARPPLSAILLGVGAGSGRSDEVGPWAPASLDELVRALPDHLPELVCVVDEDGEILWCNLTSEAVLGWDRHTCVGRNVVEFLHPDDVAMAYELLVSARATGPGVKEPVPYRFASAYDGWLPLQVVAVTVPLASGRTVLVVSARVVGRARQEDLISQEVDHRLTVAFDRAVLPMAKVGLDGRLLQANPALARRLGDDGGGLHGVSLLGLVGPADRLALSAALDEAATGADVEVEVHLAGERHRLHLSLVPDWLDSPMYLFVQAVPAAA